MELSGECNESIVSILVTNVISIIKSLLYKIITRINLRASNFQNFPGGHAPRPPSISMLCMLIVLRTTWVASQSLQLPL